MSVPVRQIGRYRIEEVIGTGAFASVYRAVDQQLDATVAVKLLADNHCLDPEIRARFIEEGRALRRVDSPHVVRVYDAGETEQLQPYLVMEHADRGSLATRVPALRDAGWRPAPADIRALAVGLAAAVQAVHAADLVHRDLSPGNVLVRSAPTGAHPNGAGIVAGGERLLLADLGLAKDLARSSGLTVAGGTDGFRPPEQRDGPSRVDGRADIWALSALLFWLVVGSAPSADAAGDGSGAMGPGGAARAAHRLAGALDDLGLPASLADPILAGLRSDPARRPPDAAAWQDQVEEALRPPHPAPPVPSDPPGSPPPASGRRGPRLAGRVGLVGAGLLLGAAGWALAGPDDPTPAATTTTDLGDGRIEAAAAAGEARLAVVGPATATVGDVVTLEAVPTGVATWVWLMPDGTVRNDADQVRVEGRSAGIAEVTLAGVSDGGEHLRAVFEVAFAADR